MGRRKKIFIKIIYPFSLLLVIILSLALLYQFIIKDRTDSSAEENILDSDPQSENVENLTNITDSNNLDDIPPEDSDNEDPTEIPIDDQEIITEPEIESENGIDKQELIIIADGNDLLAPVNKQTTLRPEYEPEDLQPIPLYMKPPREMKLREPALRKLTALWHAAEFDGVALTVISAYRSYDYQKDLFQRYADSHGEKAANRFSARAGQSEHQLGTTVDFGGSAVDLKTEFAETDQGRWLAENAHLFGFVMSYPQDSEHITGYIFEPWHYRYVGVKAALEIKDSGLTLTEYLMQ